MSDLQCAASILLARSGDALSGELTPRGREQATALGRDLRHRRVAMVYSGPQASAVQTAELAAGRLGAPVEVRGGLAPVDPVGEPAGTPTAAPAQLPGWLHGELGELADLHRGETVLVVAAAEAVAQPLEATVDGDGWVCKAWADGMGR